MKNGFAKWLIMVMGGVVIAAILIWGVRASRINREQMKTESPAGGSEEVTVTPTAAEVLPTETPATEEDLEKELKETETEEIEVVIEGWEQL